jgi:hypothetical protein
MHAGHVPEGVTNTTEWLQRNCEAKLTGSQLYSLQNLFSIYVHRWPDSVEAPLDSIFAYRDIPKRYGTSSCSRLHAPAKSKHKLWQCVPTRQRSCFVLHTSNRKVCQLHCLTCVKQLRSSAEEGRRLWPHYPFILVPSAAKLDTVAGNLSVAFDRGVSNPLARAYCI